METTMEVTEGDGARGGTVTLMGLKVTMEKEIEKEIGRRMNGGDMNFKIL